MKDELAAVIDELLAGELSPGRRYEKLDTGDDLYSVRLNRGSCRAQLRMGVSVSARSGEAHGGRVAIRRQCDALRHDGGRGSGLATGGDHVMRT